jgi:hypothetical protein
MGQRPRPLVLTIVDTTGIQEYIFGSNKLQHSIGASYLVHWATNGAVYETLHQLEGGASATNVSLSGVIDNDRQLGADGVAAELIYSGGGNAVILFRDCPLAQQFTRCLTRRLLAEAPGLQVVVVHREAKDAAAPLAGEVQSALKTTAEKKQQRRHSMPLLGLGVTAMCGYTGMPAVAEDEDGRLISAEIQAKIAVIDDAEKRLRADVKDQLRDAKLWFIRNFDDLGTKGESSYMAVVHIDGNGMGKRVEALAHSHHGNDDDYISAMRRFADSVRNVATSALRDTVSTLQLAIRKDDKGRDRIGRVVPLYRDLKEQKDRLPFRPIVFGGDDATFVCDGRLGLTLAEFYLHAMEQELSDKEKLYARAGVAVVKSHYPFSRAYELAEELAGSAKKLIKEQLTGADVSGLSAMDWHFGVNGVVLGLEDLRARDYRCPSAGELTMRPVLVNDAALPEHKRTWRTWRTFTTISDIFTAADGDWAQSRNKLKKLREALRAGPEATKQFLQVAAPVKTLYHAPGHDESAQTGWIAGDRSTCFDAVEALDFYVPLVEATAPGGEQ